MKSRSPHYVDYGLNSPPPDVRGASYLLYSLSSLPPFPFIIGYQIPRRPKFHFRGYNPQNYPPVHLAYRESVPPAAP